MRQKSDVPKEESMDWFQAILLALVLIAFAYWVYGRFISGQRRVQETPPVREEAPVQTEAEARKERPGAAVDAIAPDVREEGRVRTEDHEGKPEAVVKAVPPPAKEKGLPQGRAGLIAMPAEGAQVAYPVDFNYEPKRGEARFLHDPESGARIWVSGGCPQDHFAYSGGMRSGLAHGEGEAVLRVGPADHSPRRVQGQFRDGIFMGNDPFPNRIVALLSGDFLIQLPCSRGDGAEFWVQTGFETDCLQLRLGQKGYPPNLLVVAPSGLQAIEEGSVRDLMKQAYESYCSSCEPVREAWVRVVPRKYFFKPDYNRTLFEPVMATAQVSGGPGKEVQFYNYQNPEAKEAEGRRKAKQREEARKREEEMGPLRGRPEVRGVRLGMRIEEVREILKGEVAEWEGPRETPREDQRYFRPSLKIRLQDGATIKAEFTSRVSGSQLFVIVFEQYYREGVPYQEVIHMLEQKYGKPDDLRKLPSGDQRATYGLVSTIKPPDKAFGPGGAFFKTHVTPHYNTDFAEKLDIVFNDATLGYHDEAAIQNDQRDAARRKFEESKSNKVKF